MSTTTVHTTGRGEIIASLDFGTHSLKCVIGLVADDGHDGHPDGAHAGQIDIIGTGSAPMRGMRGGLVHNRAELCQTIKRVKEEAEMMAGCELREVVASISGLPVDGLNGYGAWRIRGGEVVQADVLQVLDIAQAQKLPFDREVLHCVPGLFQVDDQRNIGKPVGIRGVRLEAEAHLIVGQPQGMQDVESAARSVGLTIKGFVHAGVAAAETLIADEDRELGCALVDIGGQSTEISVFKHRALVHTAVLPVGGEHVTADLHECLQLPTAEAERAKQQSGCALSWMVGDHEQVELPGGGGRRPRTIKKSQLSGVIEARYEEIVGLVGHNLETAGWPANMLASVVFTGGAANIPGLTELADRVFASTTSRGEPRGVSGLVDVVRNPKYATGTGLLLAAVRGHDVSYVSPKPASEVPSLWTKLLNWIR